MMMFEYFKYILIFLIFGTRPVLYKYIVPYIQVESMILISGVFYLILAIFYVYFTKPSKLIQDVRTMNKTPSLHLALWSTALLGLIATHFYLDLLKDSSAFLLTAVLSAYPLVTAVVGYLFLNEVITRKQFIGMLVIIAGVMILNFGDFDY
jgi:drug/metabolite transporter (DMT)-like permease